MINLVKAPTKREKAINYFIENCNPKREDFHNYIIFEYTSKNNKPAVVIFAPRGIKPEYHYGFRTIEEAQKFVTDQKKYIQNRFEQDQREQKRHDEEKKGFEKGKIVVSSWGCEQTNIDFYLIVDRKNDFVTLQEIGGTRIYGGYDDRGTTIPDLTIKKGEPFKKKISIYASIKFESYKYGRLWDGKPEYFSSYA